MASTKNFAKILLFVVLASSAYAITDCTDINVSGAYVLENSITNTAVAQCINISVSDVSINGQGFTIDGVDTLTLAYGIQIYNASATLNNITIGNITVSDFSNGIYMKNMANVSMENSTIVSNKREGLYAINSVDVLVSGSTIDNNTREGASFSTATRATIINSRFIGNTRYAILFYPASGVNITNNTIMNTNRPGISTWYISDGYIIGNVMVNNTWQGIDHSGSNNTLIENNSITGSATGGIVVSFGSYNNVVRGNIVNGSGVRGIADLQGVNNTYEDNEVYGTSAPGFIVQGSSNDTFDGNTVYNNSFNGFVLNLSTNTVLTGNIIFNNSPYGIYILNSSETSIEDSEIYLHNETSGAGVYGFNASSTTIRDSIFHDNYEGIFIKFSSEINLTNNTFNRHGKEAMRLIAVNGSVISDNFDNNSVEQSIQISEIPTTYNPAVRNILISGNRFYGNVDDGGIGVYPGCENGTIINNEVTGSSYGIKIMDGMGFVVANNTLVGTNYDFAILDYNVSKNNRSYCNHFVENNTGTGGKPIFYTNESANVTGDYSAILLCGADNSIMDGVSVNGDATYRSNFIWILKSENVTVRNAVLNNTYYGLVIYEWSHNFRGNNITSENGRDEGVFIGISNNSLLSNSTIIGAQTVGLWLSSVMNTTVENVLISNNSRNGGRYSEITFDKLMLYGDTTDYGNPTNNTLRNVTIYGSSNYVYHNSTGDNTMENFSICADSQLPGCVKWDSLVLDSKQQLNSSNFIVDNYFASLNSSYSNASLFNSSANITLAADCSAGILHSIYRMENFSSSAADIVANGTLYAPNYMECSNDYLTFSVASFSGYALEDGTLNLTLHPFATVMPHTETNASCDSSDASVVLELYRDGALVANGTSHVEDLQNLSSGAYVYVCNSTNSSASYATDTLTVKAQGIGGSTGPLSVGVSGERVVGSTLTITVRDGATLVSGAEVRVLYWTNGILNAMELGETDSGGQVEFVPTVAGAYAVEAAASGYSGGELEFIVEAAQEETVGESETGNGVPETGCAGGCSAGYGCINVQCVMIGGQPPTNGSAESSPILPVVASPAWEGDEGPAEREVVSSGQAQGANPSDGKGEPINPLVIIVPLVVAAALLMWRRKNH
ncbi:MAG: right-handed parallel beta-helix repeat-containing protein [Candidatus Micrarchaeia archaeon]|jgi:nitrous oxidase accessory protein NosD